MPGSVSKETPGNTFRPEASPGGFLKTRHTAQAIKIRLAHGTVLTSLNYSSRDTFGGGGGGGSRRPTSWNTPVQPAAPEAGLGSGMNEGFPRGRKEGTIPCKNDSTGGSQARRPH